jgi:hypothetical protein
MTEQRGAENDPPSIGQDVVFNPPWAVTGTPGEHSAEPASGWISPGPDRPRRRSWLRTGCWLILVLSLVGSLAATALLDALGTGAPGSGAPEAMSVAIGTGGSGCTVTNIAETFPLGVQVRHVVTFSPPLPAGATVSIRVERDGVELTDLRQTISFDEPAPCIHGAMTPPETGHYRLVYEINPSSMPPLSGEFEVTS